jgi:hypothetical protein
MSVLVPCVPGGAANWTQSTALDGVDFVLAFDWNQRVGRWSMTLATGQGVVMRAGMVLNVGTRLLRGLTTPGRPAGELVVVDTLERWDLEPGFADLGARFQLVYFDAAEVRDATV